MPIVSGGGGTTGGSFTPDTDMPWAVDVSPITAPVATVGTWAFQNDSQDVMAGAFTNNAAPAVNDAITYNVTLAAGTWTIRCVLVKSTSSGIATVQIDGSTVGTLDAYNGATLRMQLASLTGIAVATTGLHTLKFLMATKNVASTNFVWFMLGASLLRTA